MNKRIYSVGFTLVELLIVIVILGLLGSIVAPKMLSKVSTARDQVAKAQMKVIATALDSHRLDVSYYPQTLEELRKSDKKGWDGPYFPKQIPLDPWNNAYVYENKPNEATGEGFTLKSLGRDGKLGGEGEDADVEF